MFFITSRRKFPQGLASGGALVSLNYSPAHAADALDPGYRAEDLYRNKWTWNRVARGTHGTNRAGAGLIEPVSMACEWRYLGYRPLAFAPNQAYKDFTCNFEKADWNAEVRVSA